MLISLTVDHVQPDPGGVQVCRLARVVALVGLDDVGDGEGGDRGVVGARLEVRLAPTVAHHHLVVVVPGKRSYKLNRKMRPTCFINCILVSDMHESVRVMFLNELFLHWPNYSSEEIIAN